MDLKSLLESGVEIGDVGGGVEVSDKENYTFFTDVVQYGPVVLRPFMKVGEMQLGLKLFLP